MIQPMKNIVELRKGRPRRNLGAVNHQHRQTQTTRGLQLGTGTNTTGIFGNHQINTMGLHQCPIVCDLEWSARKNDIHIVQRQAILWRVDQPHKVMMLLTRREGGKVLFANGQKDAFGRVGQCGDSGVDVCNVFPAIFRLSPPRRAFERSQRNICTLTRQYGVFAHLRRERMRCIYHGRYFGVTQICRQTVDTSETADPGLQGLGNGRRCTASIGKHGIVPTRKQGLRKVRGFGGTAQNEGARHG